jgi:hypothetical protein
MCRRRLHALSSSSSACRAVGHGTNLC